MRFLSYRSAGNRMLREQSRLRRHRAETVPVMTVKVTVERRQGTIVTSSISGVGVDVEAALWNARSRAKNLLDEIGDHLARLPEEEEL